MAKASPYYAGSKYDLVLGGQASFPARNTGIHNASASHDSLAVAPYFGGNIDSFSTNEELFGPLFAEPEMLSQSGYMRQNSTNMAASSRPVPLSIYEVNLHTTNGSISQAALDSFTPSIGAGVAVADHMLLMLRDLGIRNQCLFSLTQLAFGRQDGKYVLLWSVVRDMGVTDRKRPQFLALKLANEVAAGNLMQTTHTGDNPTWNQPLVNGIQYSYPGKDYDLVAMFDCLHDMGDPIGATAHVLQSLKPDAAWMIVEPFAHDHLEENLNAVGRVFYSASTFICTPASRAQEVGMCLGAQSGEARMREVVTKGGFKHFRRATETPFNLVYEARP